MGTEPRKIMYLIFGVVITIIAMILTGVMQSGWNIMSYVVMAIVGAFVLMLLDITDGDVERPWLNSILLGFIIVGLVKIIQVIVDWVIQAIGLTA